MFGQVPRQKPTQPITGTRNLSLATDSITPSSNRRRRECTVCDQRRVCACVFVNAGLASASDASSSTGRCLKIAIGAETSAFTDLLHPSTFTSNIAILPSPLSPADAALWCVNAAVSPRRIRPPTLSKRCRSTTAPGTTRRTLLGLGRSLC